MSYDIKHKSHDKRLANGIEYESEGKTNQEDRVKLSYVETLTHLSIIYKVEPVDVSSTYIGVDELIADLYNVGQIQELSKCSRIT